jgi:hypothetical protein
VEGNHRLPIAALARPSPRHVTSTGSELCEASRFGMRHSAPPSVSGA